MGNDSSKHDSSTIRISIIGSGLTELPKCQIQAKKNKLEALNLTCNSISGDIDVGPLPALQALILWGNHITGLSLGNATLSRLKVVDLGNNRLTSFPPGLGRACPNLAELNLSSNNLSCIPDHELAACAKLAVLKIQNNQLEALPESVGALPDLKCLLAHGNKITALPTLRDCCKLEELQINENQIEELADDVFLGLGALHTLDMTCNRLRRVPASVWRLKKLKAIRAGRNVITDLGLGTDTVEPLPFLESVILSYNGVCDIPAALLHCWAHATMLDLSHNRIEQLPASVAALAGADTLQLRGFKTPLHPSRVQVDSDVGLEDLSGLRKDIDGSLLFQVGFNAIKAIPEEIQSLPKLTELHLNNNALEDDAPGLEALGRCIGLRTLNLSFNKLLECPPSISRLPYMNSLSLAGNMISSFNLRCSALSSAVANPFALKIVLDLSFNQLTAFPNCIYDMAALEEIRIFGNRLTSLPNKERLVGRLPQLKVVSLSVDVPAPEVAEFCDYVRRHGKQVLRIYIDNRNGCVAWETENVHKGERGLFRDQHTLATADHVPETLAHSNAGVAQITGTASHPIEDRMMVGHVAALDADFFGLFDGHAGDVVANAAREMFPLELESLGENGATAGDALRDAYEHVNDAVKTCISASKDSKDATSGSTSVVTLVNDSTIVTGNTGDSRAILIGDRGQGEVSMTLLSKTHNPGYRDEWERIRLAGAYVTERLKPGGLIVDGCRLVVPRDDGGFQSLGVSRSLGDFHCAPALSGEPSMSTRAVAAGDRYLVLCTDGVTDVMTEEEVATFVAGAVKRADELGAQHIATEYEEEKEAAEQPDPGKRSRAMRRAVLSAVSQWLCLHARSLGSVDDVSAIVVELNSGAHS